MQPLDLAVNDEFKDSFSRWYANKVKEALDKRADLDKVKLDLRASLIKPLHGNWLITAMSTVESQSGTIMRGWEYGEFSVNCDFT